MGGIVTPPPDGFTFYLVASDLASAVPAGATIQGISFQIERRGNVSVGVWKDSVVTLWNGAATGTNQASSTSWGGSTDSTVTYGGSADLWGLALTPDFLNLTSFGVAVSVAAVGLDMEDGSPEVDFIGNMTIYYIEAAVDSSDAGPRAQCA